VITVLYLGKFPSQVKSSLVKSQVKCQVKKCQVKKVKSSLYYLPEQHKSPGIHCSDLAHSGQYKTALDRKKNINTPSDMMTYTIKTKQNHKTNNWVATSE